jgi:type IV secretory pathway TraG/TraD family ATPase VirD4
MRGGVADRIWVAVGLGAAATMASVWLGAALACLVTGHPVPPGSPPVIAAAAAGMAAHPGDPALAWSRKMPGPIPIWSATVAAAAAVGALGWLLRDLLRDEQTDGLGVTRSARFARRRDLRRLRITAPEPGRLILGRVRGAAVAPETNGSVCVVGNSRSGKTSGLIVPAILDMGPGHGALLAVSIKGDVVAATVKARERIGQVLVFDPTCATVDRSATWTPLRAAGNVTGAQAAARALVDVADSGGIEDAKFWMNAAYMLLWPLFFVARATDGSMRDVVRWVATHDRPAIDGLTGRIVDPGDVGSRLARLRDACALAAGEDTDDLAGDPQHSATEDQLRQLERRLQDLGAGQEDVALADDALKGTWTIDDRTRSNIYATARGVIDAWSNPVIARSADGCQVDPGWLFGAENTVYVVAPARDQKRLRPVFAGLIADIVNAGLDQATRAGGSLERPLVCALDEVANIAPIKELPTWCSTCAGHGIVLLTAWQDRSQQRDRYGREGAETIWNNSAAKVVLSGLADHATAEISGLLGTEEYERTTRSRDGAAGRGRWSYSTQEATRPLVTEDSLRRQDSGQALLVYRNLPPARLLLRPWYKDARLVALNRGEPR